VGGNLSIRAMQGYIAPASHQRDLEAAHRRGEICSDLFYRLNVFRLRFLLSGKKEDIPLLVEYFIDVSPAKAGKSIRGITKDTEISFLPGQAIFGVQNVVGTFCMYAKPRISPWMRVGYCGSLLERTEGSVERPQSLLARGQSWIEGCPARKRSECPDLRGGCKAGASSINVESTIASMKIKNSIDFKTANSSKVS